MVTNSINSTSNQNFNGTFTNSICNRCTLCIHTEVCALKSDYEKAMQQAIVISCEPFKLELRCPYFSSITNTRTFIYGDTNCCAGTSTSISNLTT